MRKRRHHNNTGLRQIKRGNTADQVRRMARRLGVPYVIGKQEKVMGGWQTIETAPKDGSPILAINANYAFTLNRYKVVYWDEDEEMEFPGWHIPEDPDDAPAHTWLTHWMPLPEPPTVFSKTCETHPITP